MPGPKNSVIYIDDLGKRYLFDGGTRTWRNHNPGNIHPSKSSRKNNQIGVAAKFSGWISKAKCISLAEQGIVDAVVCVSCLGNRFVRSRPGDSFEDRVESS